MTRRRSGPFTAAALGPVAFKDSTDLALGRCVGRMVLERLRTRAQPAR